MRHWADDKAAALVYAYPSNVVIGGTGSCAYVCKGGVSMIKVPMIMLASACLLFSLAASATHQQAPAVTKKPAVSAKQAPKALKKAVVSAKQAPKAMKKPLVSAKQAPKAMIKPLVSAKQAFKGVKNVEPLPRDLEIQLALSALPQHLRENATVYVLNPAKGFEVACKGTNGFHALVARTDDGALRGSWNFSEYREDILIPISYDTAGARAHMRVILDVAAMQAMGTSPANLKKVIQGRYRTGYYKAPARVGVSYMLSPILRTYENPDASDTVITVNMPHVMYYAPNVTNNDIGGKPMSIYPFVILPGRHGYIVQALGQMEKQAINKEYETMLGRLCTIKEAWCLPKVDTQQ